MNIIETRRLTKDFGNNRGLFDLDLSLPRGRIHGFLGPNGAGKTTAIRLLLGFLKPTRGGARVMGLDPTHEAQEIMAHVGYVPGELALPEMMTGAEFLGQSAAIRDGVDPAWREALIRRLRAEPWIKIGKLSKGNRQKIALIDALQHRPELLILDEPTDGLDPLLRHEVRHILTDHVGNGGTVFLSSHVVHEIQTICDDVSIVLRGRLRTQARIADLLAEEGLRVEATLEDPETAREPLAEAGGEEIETAGTRIRFRVHGNPLPALGVLAELGASEPKLRQEDLEQTFLRLYRGEEEPG